MNNNPKNNRSTNRYKSLFTFAASSLLLAAISLAYWWVWIEYYSENIVQPFWTKGHVLLFLVYFVLLLLLTNIYGSQGITAKRIWDVIYTHALSLLLTNVITYFQICLLTVKMVPVLPLALMTLADVGLIAIWAIGTKTLYRTLFPPSRLIVVYDDYDPSDTVDKLSKMNDQYIIGETISVSGGLQPVYRAMRDYDGVVLCDVHASDKSEIVKNCYKNDIPLYISPKLSDIIIRGAENSNVIDAPILICHNGGLRAEHRLVKRLFDLLVIIPFSAVLAPFMIIAALAVKLYDGGDVFYKQERLTEGGRVFWIYKFRSMRMDSENGQARLAGKNDSRITPIGKFLRSTHLDETPQIFNIIKGEMSIVGPRPERPEIAAEYQKHIPEFDFRLKAKAGLTGYAQVFGRYNTTPYNKLKLDLFYIQNQSLLLDIELVFKTVQVIFEKDNTEGLDEGQTTAAERMAPTVEQDEGFSYDK